LISLIFFISDTCWLKVDKWWLPNMKKTPKKDFQHLSPGSVSGPWSFLWWGPASFLAMNLLSFAKKRKRKRKVFQHQNFTYIILLNKGELTLSSRRPHQRIPIDTSLRYLEMTWVQFEWVGNWLNYVYFPYWLPLIFGKAKGPLALFKNVILY
jgi:hypothetical protein